jgi:hypothetical protein
MNVDKHSIRPELLRRADRDDRFIRPHLGTHANWSFSTSTTGMSSWMATGMSTCSRSAIGSPMTVSECWRSNPRIERVFVAPAGDDQPLVTAVGRLEKFKSFKPFSAIDCTRTGSESVSEFVTGLSRDGDGIDTDNRHGLSWLPPPAGRASPAHP